MVEYKWTNEKVNVDVLDTLMERSQLFHYKNVQHYLFAKGGFTKGCVEKADELGNVILATFDEIVKVDI